MSRSPRERAAVLYEQPGGWRRRRWLACMCRSCSRVQWQGAGCACCRHEAGTWDSRRPGARRHGGRGRPQEPLPSQEDARGMCLTSPVMRTLIIHGLLVAPVIPARSVHRAGRLGPVRPRSRDRHGPDISPAPFAEGPCPHSGRSVWSPCASANPNALSPHHSCGLLGSQTKGGKRV
jgi:hypothetical protein